MSKSLPHTQNHAEDIQKLGELIKDIQIAMLVTEINGCLRSRPMVTQNQAFDGELWFITAKSTPKMEEIEGHQQVNIAYADPGKAIYVSVSGCAEAVDNRQKIRDLWQPAHQVWFPQGPEDPNIVLLKIKVEAAEYWDSNKAMTLFGMAKAFVKGERYQGEGAQHKKVEVSAGNKR